jgi:hypothetical protein
VYDYDAALVANKVEYRKRKKCMSGREDVSVLHSIPPSFG